MSVPKLCLPESFKEVFEVCEAGSSETMSTDKSPELRKEIIRLESFDDEWKSEFVSKNDLAKYGFYNLKRGDFVKCHFCKVEIGIWEKNDNVIYEHLRWSPLCPLMRKEKTNNEPIDESFLDNVSEPSQDTCGIVIKNSVAENSYISTSTNESESNSDDSNTSESSIGYANVITAPFSNNVQRKILAHPEYDIEAKRLETFEDWPKIMKQKPEDLSDAGFFYTKRGDRVKCFSCGGGLKDWEFDDDPWEQHAIWYKDCEYVALVKGQEFIRKCLESNIREQSQSEPSKANTKPTLALSEEITDDTRLCKICYMNEIDTVFLSCGHVTACAKCASSLKNTCPICRNVSQIKRLYFN